MPPVALRVSSRVGRRANHVRAVPAAIAHVLSDTAARTPKTRPSSIVCSATGPLGSVNCGRKATKNTMVFGLVAPTVKPIRTGCPRRTGASAAIASRASLRCRIACTPSHTTYAAPRTFTAVYAVALAATTAPSPTATRTTWATSPRALPTTESSASRRPTVSARPMVKSRLGPGTWMNRIEATRKAAHWLDDGMATVWGRDGARGKCFAVAAESLGDSRHRAPSTAQPDAPAPVRAHGEGEQILGHP